ncbi:MAG: hypothetical protein IKR39_02780 [Lachnospiraceae bacterium]|nr:hypothetical protein [Lachnospiraceae bacterium]
MKSGNRKTLICILLVIAALFIAFYVFPRLLNGNGYAGVDNPVVTTSATAEEESELVLLTSTESSTEALIETSTETTVETSSEISTEPEEEETVEYRFRSKKLLNQHYDKHGIEMGFESAADYEKAASAVVNNPDALHKTEKEDGDDVYYLKATNEFVIVSKDGYIRTYFNPRDGIDYFNRQ